MTTTGTAIDITTYNAFVQGAANGTPTLGGGTWKVIASSQTVAAQDNTGTDPGVADAAGLVAGELSTGGNSTFTFTHPQNASPAGDITASYQWSTDLENFFGSGVVDDGTLVTFSTAADTPSPGITTVTATITVTTPDKLFVRVDVTMPAL